MHGRGIRAGIWLAVVGAGLSLAGSGVAAQEPLFVVPEVQMHRLRSQFVDQEFEIHVGVPVSRRDGSERFPVLYMTDSQGGLMFGAPTRMMQTFGDVERFIMVGIGYPGENVFSGMRLRTRDLTSVESGEATPDPWDAWVPGVPGATGQQTGGGAEFLRFLRDELVPFIDARYPTIAGDRGYWGDSLGGLFGLYVMFNEPDTFNRYIIGSPSIWWEGEDVLHQAEEFIAHHDQLEARVFMAVGGLEEVDPEALPFRMVTNVGRLERMLREADLEGFELSTHVFPDETHMTVYPLNYYRGIQMVYGRGRSIFESRSEQ
ncbi:MAG TPA: alpha/beta hydrolase-fold protein [Acidobacteriota bacterium]|nr:alpha/beta hydrolase-fold protein [Acidobacteriota bacterium]